MQSDSAAANWLPLVTLEQWASFSTIAASIAVVVTAGLFWRQMQLQSTDVGNDEKRFVRESIHFLHETLQDVRFREARREYFRGSVGKPYDEISEANRDNARHILSFYGMVSRMIHRDAIDANAFHDFWLSTFKRDWTRLNPFVDAQRKSSKNPELFIETEKLLKRWDQST